MRQIPGDPWPVSLVCLVSSRPVRHPVSKKKTKVRNELPEERDQSLTSEHEHTHVQIHMHAPLHTHMQLHMLKHTNTYRHTHSYKSSLKLCYFTNLLIRLLSILISKFLSKITNEIHHMHI